MVKKSVKDKEEKLDKVKKKQTKDMKTMKLLQQRNKLEQKVSEFEMHQKDILAKIRTCEGKLNKYKQMEIKDLQVDIPLPQK